MKVFTAAMLIAMTVSVPVAAKDRAPTRAERDTIEKKLRSLGYTSWDDIKLDDDRPYHQPKWEIDDARKGNGPRFDIELEPRSLKVLQTERDD
ncbi:PepSY domain-containing protein [Sphingomonas koreensis]